MRVYPSHVVQFYMIKYSDRINTLLRFRHIPCLNDFIYHSLLVDVFRGVMEEIAEILYLQLNIYPRLTLDEI